MYCRSQASASSSRNPAKQLPGSITATRLRLVTSSRLRVRLRYCVGLVHEPVVGQVAELRVVRQDAVDVAAGADHPGAELLLVGAQPQHQVVERAGDRERPPVHALRQHGGRVGRRVLGGTVHGDLDAAVRAGDPGGDERVGDGVAVLGPVQRGQRDALAGTARRGVGGLPGPAARSPRPSPGGRPCRRRAPTRRRWPRGSPRTWSRTGRRGPCGRAACRPPGSGRRCRAARRAAGPPGARRSRRRRRSARSRRRPARARSRRRPRCR